MTFYKFSNRNACEESYHKFSHQAQDCFKPSIPSMSQLLILQTQKPINRMIVNNPSDQ